MKIKRILTAALSASMLLAAAPVTADEPANPVAPPDTVVATAPPDEIRITYNGEEIKTDVPPIIVNDRTLVPARAVFEAMGCKVNWYEIDWDNREFKSETMHGITQHVDVQRTYGDYHYSASLTIGSNIMSTDRTIIYATDSDVFGEVTLEVPAQLIGDRTMIPVRAVAEALDAKVDWDEETRTVIITDGSPEPETTPAPGPTADNPSFALRLKEQMPADKNYMVSPFSIKVALAMAANGGEGAAKDEILKTLGIDDLDEFNGYVKDFIADNNSAKGKNADREKNEAEGTDTFGTKGQRAAEFELADSIWFNKDYYGSKAPKAAFAPEFEKTVADYYDGKAGIVTDKDAVDTINSWISDKTRGKITNVLSDPEFLAALVNTIYMKAQWADQFSEGMTRKDTFTDRNGKETEIDFMNDTDHYQYYSDADTQMVRLPYYGGFSMYVVLGDSSNFEAEREAMESKKVALSLPKWKTESTFEMKDILTEMGITTAFSTGFSPMFINLPEGHWAWIDDVIHKTYIDVDEEGTEAAAVTAVMMVAGSASMPQPEEIVEFKADEPFTYFICDDDNGEILFMGEYAYAE